MSAQNQHSEPLEELREFFRINAMSNSPQMGWVDALEEQLEALQQKSERQATNIGALYRQRRGCETVLISIAEWVEEHFREGDKEYQLALIARAASPATGADSIPASEPKEE